MSDARTIALRPLTAEAFAAFGTVLDARGEAARSINAGLCARHHDLAAPDVADGRIGMSVFDAAPRALPYRFDLLERHPLGTQAFVPMHAEPFLVIAAPDEAGRPGAPLAFLTDGAQGVQIGRGVWHGILTPLAAPGLFCVIDYCGPRENLEEHRTTEPWTVLALPPEAAER